jgi:hypothetical protein
MGWGGAWAFQTLPGLLSLLLLSQFSILEIHAHALNIAFDSRPSPSNTVPSMPYISFVYNF